jgi:hypothetical protein
MECPLPHEVRVMARLLAPTAAVLFACALAAPAAAAEPPGFAERVERIGKLPGELVKAKKLDADVTDAIFLATLSRLPTDKEKETGSKFLARAGASEKARAAAARDLAWAAVNSKEFLKLHGLDGDPAAGLRLLNALTAKWPDEANEKN